MKTLGFIGGGRITRILLNGFKNAGVSFGKISVYETNETVLNTLKNEFPQIGTSVADPSTAAAADWVFIALHPPVLMETLNAIRNSVRKDALVISLAPKITIEKIRSVLTAVPGIARMNPNAGSYVMKGFNPVCFAQETDKNAVKEFIEIFNKIGKTPVVPENQIEAYAVISAMGHTYFWYQFQQMRELGRSYGLTESEADEAVSSMITGTSETLFNSGLSFEKVVDLVPVKPMAEHENTIREFYKASLDGIYQKIKPV